MSTCVHAAAEGRSLEASIVAFALWIVCAESIWTMAHQANSNGRTVSQEMKAIKRAIHRIVNHDNTRAAGLALSELLVIAAEEQRAREEENKIAEES